MLHKKLTLYIASYNCTATYDKDGNRLLTIGHSTSLEVSSGNVTVVYNPSKVDFIEFREGSFKDYRVSIESLKNS